MTTLALLLSLTALSAAALETNIEFTDKIVRIKDNTAQPGTYNVSFEKHAAVYHINKKLLQKALDSKKTGQPVVVSAQSESMRITKITSKRDLK